MLGEVTVTSEIATVAVHGDLDLSTVDGLRSLLDGVVAGPVRTVVVDVSAVDFVDVLSLSVILGAADALRESDRRLHLRGASAALQRMCTLLNATDILAPVLPTPRCDEPAE